MIKVGDLVTNDWLARGDYSASIVIESNPRITKVFYFKTNSFYWFPTVTMQKIPVDS